MQWPQSPRFPGWADSPMIGFMAAFLVVAVETNLGRRSLSPEERTQRERDEGW